MGKITALIAISAISVFSNSVVNADDGATQDAGTTIAVVPTDFCNAGSGYVALRTPEFNQGQVIIHAAVFQPGGIVNDYENQIGYGATANYGFNYVGDNWTGAIQVVLYAEYLTSNGDLFTSANVGIDLSDACLTVEVAPPVVFEPAPAPPVAVIQLPPSL